MLVNQSRKFRKTKNILLAILGCPNWKHLPLVTQYNVEFLSLYVFLFAPCGPKIGNKIFFFFFFLMWDCLRIKNNKIIVFNLPYAGLNYSSFFSVPMYLAVWFDPPCFLINWLLLKNPTGTHSLSQFL